MPEKELMKRITVDIPLSEWKHLRQEAAKLRVSQAEVLRMWISKGKE
jgi:hypothetical protein